jgi:hypothetical protein
MQIYDSSRETVNIRSHLTFNNYREAFQIRSRALEETEKRRSGKCHGLQFIR